MSAPGSVIVAKLDSAGDPFRWRVTAKHADGSVRYDMRHSSAESAELLIAVLHDLGFICADRSALVSDAILPAQKAPS